MLHILYLFKCVYIHIKRLRKKVKIGQKWNGSQVKDFRFGAAT